MREGFAARRNDSYVLPLTDAEHIEHARALVAQGAEVAGTPIVVAAMHAGTDGINRDLHAEGAHAWSWHVTEIITFADRAIRQCPDDSGPVCKCRIGNRGGLQSLAVAAHAIEQGKAAG